MLFSFYKQNLLQNARLFRLFNQKNQNIFQIIFSIKTKPMDNYLI